MILIDGKEIAKKIEHGLKEKLSHLSRPPGLAFILVGNHPASYTYVHTKKKKCQELGIFSVDFSFPEDVSEKKLLLQIEYLNADPIIDSILVQLPLPAHLSSSKIMESISPQKDVDCFHPLNMGRLLLGEECRFLPCTPHAIQKLLLAYDIPLQGKHVVILGRSNIVGKPLAALLMQKKEGANATVTVAHRLTSHLTEITKSADILVAAIGSPHFVKAPMVKKGAVVIDVGINRVGTKIVGDVDFENVSSVASYLTPVPGGVGPMTIAMLMSNTFHSTLK